MATQDYAALARTTYEQFNRHNFDRALEGVSDAVEIEVYAQGLSLRGRDGFRQMMKFHKAPWPDGTVTVVSQLVGEEGVTNECLYHATHTQPLPMPDGTTLPPTGKKLELRFIEVWRYKNGELVSLHNYSDSLALLQQLGVIPAPAQAVG
jgi:ketosteroid isomerase-like protein